MEWWVEKGSGTFFFPLRLDNLSRGQCGKVRAWSFESGETSPRRKGFGVAIGRYLLKIVPRCSYSAIFLQICGPFFTSVYWGAVTIGPYVDLKYWLCVGPLWSFLGGLVYHGCTVLFSKTCKMLSQSNVKNWIWRSVARKRSSFYNWLEPFHLMQTHYWCNHWVLVFHATKAFLNIFLHWQSWHKNRPTCNLKVSQQLFKNTHLMITHCTCVCAANIFSPSPSCILTTTLAILAKLLFFLEAWKTATMAATAPRRQESREKGEGRHRSPCSSSCVSSFRENLACDFQTHAGVTGGGEAAGWF